jgi:hypothetical protein
VRWVSYREGVGNMEGRNDPNSVCTYAYMNKEKKEENV